MDTGLLWYEPSTKLTLAEKVQAAVDFYAAKYGQRPTECHVHYTMLPESTPKVLAGCRMCASRAVLRNHFWLGVSDTPAEAPDKPIKAIQGLSIRR